MAFKCFWLYLNYLHVIYVWFRFKCCSFWEDCFLGELFFLFDFHLTNIVHCILFVLHFIFRQHTIYKRRFCLNLLFFILFLRYRLVRFLFIDTHLMRLLCLCSLNISVIWTIFNLGSHCMEVDITLTVSRVLFSFFIPKVL